MEGGFGGLGIDGFGLVDSGIGIVVGCGIGIGEYVTGEGGQWLSRKLWLAREHGPERVGGFGGKFVQNRLNVAGISNLAGK